MFDALFKNVSGTEKDKAVEGIIERATPRQDFFLMLTLSVAMAAFGILLNSVVILVGSMLIAPLLYPLLSLALGIIMADDKLIGRSAYTILKSSFLAIVSSAVIAFLFSSGKASLGLPFSLDVDAPSPLLYAVVAAIAGFAAAFAMVKEHLNETLPGVAISVALVPPLAAAGVALALLNWSVFSNALLLFLVNIIGIVFSSMIVFSLMRLGIKTQVAKEAIKEEDKIIEKETAQVN